MDFTAPQAKKAVLLPQMPQSYIKPSSEKVKKKKKKSHKQLFIDL